jgi:hypothetical protein
VSHVVPFFILLLMLAAGCRYDWRMALVVTGALPMLIASSMIYYKYVDNVNRRCHRACSSAMPLHQTLKSRPCPQNCSTLAGVSQLSPARLLETDINRCQSQV